MSGLYGQFDCAFPRDPKMIAAGPLGRLVYFEASLYCRENLTDGEINRLILPFFAVDLSKSAKVKLLDKLADVGALERIPIGWRIPPDVWRKWNPLRSEVEDKRKVEAERKQSYRDKQRQSRDCPDDVPPGHPVAGWDTRGQPESESQQEPETESKPEPFPEKSSSVIDLDTRRQPDDDEYRRTANLTARAVAKAHLADDEKAYARTTLLNFAEDGHAATVRDRLVAGDDPIAIAAAISKSDTAAHLAAKELA